MKTTKPTTLRVTLADILALPATRPAPDGWATIEQLADASDASAETIRRKLRVAVKAGEVEHATFRVACGLAGVTRPVMHFRAKPPA